VPTPVAWLVKIIHFCCFARLLSAGRSPMGMLRYWANTCSNASRVSCCDSARSHAARHAVSIGPFGFRFSVKGVWLIQRTFSYTFQPKRSCSSRYVSRAVHTDHSAGSGLAFQAARLDARSLGVSAECACALLRPATFSDKYSDLQQRAWHHVCQCLLSPVRGSKLQTCSDPRMAVPWSLPDSETRKSLISAKQRSS
jgi:hypothetical protein